MKFLPLAAAMLLAISRASAQSSDTTAHEALEEVRVITTRSNRSVQDIPTRIEFIAGEELDEKSNMKPGDIRMMLAESTGIQTLQTSATSANASIRIQGLDGRYTQILKDGFPMYSGAASGLGLLQTPPLDLKQVEVIKGSASTLYGGGAIAGLVNLISKTPAARELRFHINGTSALGLDANGFYGQRFGKWGTTIFASRNSNAPYDPAGIDLTAIPKFARYTFNPKIFLYPSDKTTFVIGVNATFENRIGGDLHYIREEADSLNGYYESNKTKRISATLSATHMLRENTSVSIKSSYGYFNRIIATPGYAFEGTQHTSYTEGDYSINGDKLDWVIGCNFFTESFYEIPKLSTRSPRDYSQSTVGGFVQNTWHVAEKFHLESGLRADYVVDYGFALLPRLSLLYRHGAKFSSRIGGGFGYKAPTMFTEESERIQYRNVLPVSAGNNVLERSYGTNWDVNYRSSFAKGKITFSINQLFFYTRINHPLIMQPVSFGQYRFENSEGHIDTRGAETNIKIGYRDFKLLLGYTFTDAYMHQDSSKTENLLTPKHRVNTVLMYEADEKWKIGLEAYYYSPQQVREGNAGQDYWLCGLMAERLWARISLYINFENFLDVRQTRFGAIYTGSLMNPVFKDIYAPLDGFVVNGGIKLKL